MLRDKEMLKNFRSLPLLYEKAFCKTKEKYDMTQFEVDVLGFVYFIRNMILQNKSVNLEDFRKQMYLLL